jgi:hypothetical protein
MNQVYKIDIIADTLLTNGIGFNLDLRNKSKLIDSRVIIKNAGITYDTDSYYVQTAIQDFGYGHNYFLYNRNYYDYYYNENTLLNAKWYGIHFGKKFSNSSLGCGVGENDLNGVLGEVNYKNNLPDGNITLFSHVIVRDSYYSQLAFDAGYEYEQQIKGVGLKSGFNYHFLPKSFCLPDIREWHSVNELQLPILSNLKLILSSDIQKKFRESRLNRIYEGCVDFNKGRYQVYTGFRYQNILDSKIYNPFLDINYLVQDQLSLGLTMGDFSISNDDHYVKVGIQTKYVLQ